MSGRQGSLGWARISADWWSRIVLGADLTGAARRANDWTISGIGGLRLSVAATPLESGNQRICPPAEGNCGCQVTRQCCRADERDDSAGAQFRPCRGPLLQLISQRESSWQSLLRGQSGHRRPYSSRPICSHASRRERTGERIKEGWVSNRTRSFIRARLSVSRVSPQRPSWLGGLRPGRASHPGGSTCAHTDCSPTALISRPVSILQH